MKLAVTSSMTMAAFDYLPLCFYSLLATLVTVFVLYVKHQRSYWKRRGIRSPPVHWLFGNVKDAILQKKSFAYEFGDLHQQASDKDDVLGIYVLHKPFLLLRNPEVIKQILIKDFNIFPNRYFTARSFHDKIGSSNLFTIPNPEWRYLRTKITPVFTSGKMKKLFYLIVQSSDSLKKYLEDQFAQNGSKEKSILFKEVALKYTTDIISNVAFGIHVNSFDADKDEFFNQAQKGLYIGVKRGIQFIIMFFFPALSPYLGGRMLGTSTDYFRKVFWDSFDTRETNKTKRGDLIDSLIELKNQQEDNDKMKLEGDVLVAQSAIFFIAGRESSMTTMCFALAELAKQPEIQKRTREEILQKLEEHGMTYEGVHSMKYLYQVISETLRLYPAAPLLDRVPIQDYKIPGTDIVIEKGTPVYIALCGIQRDPKYYPDPLRFDPDRFSDENKDNIKQCTYMPFGEGPRICIGQRLGLLQSAIGIITVLKDYEVLVDSTCDCNVDIRNVFMSPSNSFRLKLKKL